MKAILLPALAALALAHAQEIAPAEPNRELIPDSISEKGFESGVAGGISATADTSSPVLVTGKMPEDSEFLQLLEPQESVAPEPEGVTVRVKPGADATVVDSSKVKLLAPFPSKPLGRAPVGWRLEHPDSVPPFIREVELANGTRISLAIRPHLIVPDPANGEALAIQEPGFDPNLGHAQNRTLGAALGRSLEHMEEDSVRLGETLAQLEDLLRALPQVEYEEEADLSTPAPRATIVK